MNQVLRKVASVILFIVADCEFIFCLATSIVQGTRSLTKRSNREGGCVATIDLYAGNWLGITRSHFRSRPLVSGMRKALSPARA